MSFDLGELFLNYKEVYMMSNIFFFFPLLQAAGENPMTSTLMTFGLIAGMFLIFYFLLIRPQQKKQKDLKKMLESLKRGDKVVTIGGMWGSITEVKEKTVIVKVDDNTKLEFSRDAIGQVVSREGEVKAT
jgi:preprotein translocase subunit YajC